jgi:hypothetical protein
LLGPNGNAWRVVRPPGKVRVGMVEWTGDIDSLLSFYDTEKTVDREVMRWVPGEFGGGGIAWSNGGIFSCGGSGQASCKELRCFVLGESGLV